jgi:hypothetical protein
MSALEEYEAALREALARWPDSDWPDDAEGRLETLWWAMTDAEQEAARARAAALNAGAAGVD